MPSWARSNRPPVRAHGAGEGAAFVAEQFGFQQVTSDSAAQLTATKSRRRRRLWSCRARAVNSLPVPVSPVMTTGASVGP